MSGGLSAVALPRAAIALSSSRSGGISPLALKKKRKLLQAKQLESTQPLAKLAHLEWSRTSAMDVIRSKKSEKK
jgi:hypothetical protein